MPKIRPLLAATRNDDELRRKEIELALIKERAERDKQEREALENLKMSLENEKQTVEEDLKAERALTLAKDDLLERSKKREGQLEDEIAALQADLDNLDSQLDRALKIQKVKEEKYDSLQAAFDEAAGHLVRLEGEQREWTLKEAELTESLGAAHTAIEGLQRDRDDLQKLSEELKPLASQLEEDLLRAKERMDIATAELEAKLNIELKNRSLCCLHFLPMPNAYGSQRFTQNQDRQLRARHSSGQRAACRDGAYCNRLLETYSDEREGDNAFSFRFGVIKIRG